ncbi:hypothetical protein [Methylobacterium sp. 37f]|uniref:hypothetical protein n=1 Tax=Methylobacterium sp. 37f TaxID=2817058 RepID=UPI001FFC50E0|nr:hypothetical protein [Methylobacterium sp. 37f]MCK2057170.1 hypothetical protein [Methylobacterium sp. 37f]
MMSIALVALACHVPAPPADRSLDGVVAVLRGEALAPAPTRADVAAAIDAVTPPRRRSRP